MTAPKDVPLDEPILDAMNRITLFNLHNEGRCGQNCFVCATIVQENEPVCDGCAQCEPEKEVHCPRCCQRGLAF